MQWLVVELGGGADLGHRPCVEDEDAVAHPERDAEVVGDHDETHPTVILNAPQKGEDLALGGHVECGRRLVSDQDVRVAGERGRDGNALAHPAGQLERVAVNDAFVGDPDLGQPADRLCALLVAPELDSVPREQRLFDDPAASEHGVQHREGILEDQPDLLPANRAPLSLFQRQQVAAPIKDLAARCERRW